jgi:hypothetical protein
MRALAGIGFKFHKKQAQRLNINMFLAPATGWNALVRQVSASYNNCQKYVPIDLQNLSRVIASGAKQSRRLSKRLLRRHAPRNDRFSEQIFNNRYRSGFKTPSPRFQTGPLNLI